MTATGPYGSEEWSTLRACWLDLKQPRFQSPEHTRERATLRQRHDGALDGLAAAGLLEPGVAEAVREAFAEALSHIGMKGALCYAVMPFEAAPRQDLIAQAEALAGMAGRSRIDPATVARARTALERDMAWLAQFEAGERPDHLEDGQATPDQVEAARVLVALLLEGKVP
jgi:hypothetical protein